MGGSLGEGPINLVPYALVTTHLVQERTSLCGRAPLHAFLLPGPPNHARTHATTTHHHHHNILSCSHITTNTKTQLQLLTYKPPPHNVSFSC